MTERFPIPGEDTDTWGDILVGLLRVTLNEDGTVKKADPFGMSYVFDASTVNNNPGSGKLRLNAGAQNTSSFIYLNVIDASSANWASIWANWADNAVLQIQAISDPTQYILFTHGAVEIVTSTFVRLAVTPLAWSTASPFANGQAITLQTAVPGHVLGPNPTVPHVPSSPTVQNVVDALVTLGLVIQP